MVQKSQNCLIRLVEMRTNLFLFSTYSITQNGQKVQCLYNVFYELLTIISITYREIETEIKGQ